jgi:hypothetical protein
MNYWIEKEEKTEDIYDSDMIHLFFMVLMLWPNYFYPYNVWIASKKKKEVISRQAAAL